MFEHLFEQVPIKEFSERSYLDYSMYVILDRALPSIADGLKPVQRRIIYAMSELSLSANAKHKKSARTVGDVLGKFHPHSDTACYEALVLMAQGFQYRYPLIDGQGNFGSVDDPKSFAAMRYTEARLSSYANVLLEELWLGTTSWVDNFDGSLQEPKVLPARLPNILLNGGTGIAVGMATDIPPHNLVEVANACILLLNKPQASMAELTAIIKGPDFASKVEIITPSAEIERIYSTGYGSIRVRAKYKLEAEAIVITALPPQLTSSKILEDLAKLMQNKKLPFITDLRDESTHEEPVRLVLTLRSNRIDGDEVMLHLFAITELERNIKVNLNVIGINGTPKVKNLKELLLEWLEWREQTVKAKLNFRLDKINNRLHVLAGYLLVYLNLDAVINIIRHSEDAKEALQAKFKLSAIQADAILDIKLRNLAKLEEEKIKAEQQSLQTEGAEIEAILASPSKLKNLIKKELTVDAKTYGDERRSAIVVRNEAKVLSIVEKVAAEDLLIVLSEKGWIRAAKTLDVDVHNLSYKAGDKFLTSVIGKTTELVFFMDAQGRSYSLPCTNLPSIRGQGEPLSLKFQQAKSSNFIAMLAPSADELAILLSSSGYGFAIKIKELYSKNRTGKLIMKLKEQEELRFFGCYATYLAIVTTDNKLLIIATKELEVMTKGKGNKLIALSKGEQVKLAVSFKDGASLNIKGAKKQQLLKPKEWREYLKQIALYGNSCKGVGDIIALEVID